MKKLLFLAIFLFCGVFNVLAAENNILPIGKIDKARANNYPTRDMVITDITTSADSTTIAVASTATVYTKAINLNFSEYFTLSYIATSASSTPDLLIQIEQSWTPPSIEGSSDTNWSIPTDMINVETNLIAETVKHTAFSPRVLPWVRLKITGNASNPADTTIRVRLTQQVVY